MKPLNWLSSIKKYLKKGDWYEKEEIYISVGNYNYNYNNIIINSYHV